MGLICWSVRKHTVRFSLNDLVWVYMQKYNAVVSSNKSEGNGLTTLHDAYTNIMNLLNRDDDDRIIKLKRMIVGDTCLVDIHPEYMEIGIAVDLGLSLEDWNKKDNIEKAKIIAHRQTKSMVDIVDRYRDEMRQRMDRALNKKK